MASMKPLSFKEVRATLKRMFESSGSSETEISQGIKVKEETLYVTKVGNRPNLGSKDVVSEDSEGRISKDEEVMWTNYGNQSRFSRTGNVRYGRNRYGRYPRRNWWRGKYDSGCFECGSKDHWARNCDKKNKIANKDGDF